MSCTEMNYKPKLSFAGLDCGGQTRKNLAGNMRRTAGKGPAGGCLAADVKHQTAADKGCDHREGKKRSGGL